VSTTRLLILGVVRIFQPVHGYFVRRELLSWRAEQWANINPGSIYNALRTLTKDGFLEETGGGGPRGRTSYRLTPDGESEFITMLHEAFWSLNEYAPERMYAATAFMSYLSREEVSAALEHRCAQIEAAKLELDYREQTLRTNPTVPDHTPEILRLGVARLDGELRWARELGEKLAAGAYEFAGESDSEQRLDMAGKERGDVAGEPRS
jgi:DNA-binding PadR family transcriptional regulator